MDISYEQELTARGFKTICGIDEAGRGALAGPLVAAAVILDLDDISFLELVKDSKQLTAKQREALFPDIINGVKIWSVGVVTHNELDAHGLAFANKIAMKRAWKYLAVRPDFITTDYIARIAFETPFETVKDGDNKILSIATASVIAKVIRDRMMIAFAKKFPEYGFDGHKGYGTQLHRDRIKELGACEIHRKTFGPLKARLF